MAKKLTITIVSIITLALSIYGITQIDFWPGTDYIEYERMLVASGQLDANKASKWCECQSPEFPSQWNAQSQLKHIIDL
jgi:hypothetical protein